MYGKLDQDLDGNGFINGHTEKRTEAIKKADKNFDFSKYDINNDKKLTSQELGILIVIPQTNPLGHIYHSFFLAFSVAVYI